MKIYEDTGYDEFNIKSTPYSKIMWGKLKYIKLNSTFIFFVALMGLIRDGEELNDIKELSKILNEKVKKRINNK